MTLEEFGFSDWFSDQIDSSKDAQLKVARVTAVHKGECEVSDGETVCSAKMTGRLRHRARTRLDYATVGDWVLVRNYDGEDFGMIERILERRSELKRETAGRARRPQLIAANIDTAFIMQSLGPGFNLPRLERYLVMVHDSGIEPVLLLSKSDLLDAQERAERIEEIKARISGVRMFVFSNENHEGLEAVAALFKPRKTFCVIGISGVGKTTLLNNLMGEEDALFTLPVRESDGKGVHSTTWRELITLDNGAHVVDTPGMRELGGLDVSEGIDETFDDITALSAQCRFRDCAHVDTLGCAVEAALASGELDEARYRNYLQLTQEVNVRGEAAVQQRERERKFSRFHRSTGEGRHKKKKGK